MKIFCVHSIECSLQLLASITVSLILSYTNQNKISTLKYNFLDFLNCSKKGNLSQNQKLSPVLDWDFLSFYFKVVSKFITFISKFIKVISKNIFRCIFQYHIYMVKPFHPPCLQTRVAGSKTTLPHLKRD